MTQDKVIEFIRQWNNCFITWKAWTWKTYVVDKFIKECREKWEIIIVVAPTGIAAINIWGATYHSTFRMYGTYLHQKPFKAQAVEWRKVNRIIFDEISMVGPDTLDYIDLLLQNECWNTKPFWGIQMILVWDPYQLPPVYPTTTIDENIEVNWLKEKYWKLLFSSAKCFKIFKELTLIKIRRQKDDTFIKLLNRIRDWDRDAIYDFNRWIWTKESIHLMPYNKIVDNHNTKKFNVLKWNESVYKGRLYWNFNIKNCVTPQVLKLKIWARIMVTKNIQSWLVNWDMWTVVKLNKESVVIKSDRFNTNYEIFIEEWKEIKYDWTQEVIVWRYCQIPLKLSWAITIHKSQWLSLDNVCFHYIKWMTQELLYVWLSRCTTFENLFINR